MQIVKLHQIAVIRHVCLEDEEIKQTSGLVMKILTGRRAIAKYFNFSALLVFSLHSGLVRMIMVAHRCHNGFDDYIN